MKIKTCIGNYAHFLGTASWQVDGFGFSGKVNVIVVKWLAKDCLIGLDIASCTKLNLLNNKLRL